MLKNEIVIAKSEFSGDDFPKLVCVLATKDYKPGDLPPPKDAGYNEFVAWSEVQSKAGIKQEQCGRCSKWKTPQELSEATDTHLVSKTKFGKADIEIETLVCLECFENDSNK